MQLASREFVKNNVIATEYLESILPGDRSLHEAITYSCIVCDWRGLFGSCAVVNRQGIETSLCPVCHADALPATDEPFTDVAATAAAMVDAVKRYYNFAAHRQTGEKHVIVATGPREPYYHFLRPSLVYEAYLDAIDAACAVIRILGDELMADHLQKQDGLTAVSPETIAAYLNSKLVSPSNAERQIRHFVHDTEVAQWSRYHWHELPLDQAVMTRLIIPALLRPDQPITEGRLAVMISEARARIVSDRGRMVADQTRLTARIASQVMGWKVIESDGSIRYQKPEREFSTVNSIPGTPQYWNPYLSRDQAHEVIAAFYERFGEDRHALLAYEIHKAMQDRMMLAGESPKFPQVWSVQREDGTIRQADSMVLMLMTYTLQHLLPMDICNGALAASYADPDQMPESKTAQSEGNVTKGGYASATPDPPSAEESINNDNWGGGVQWETISESGRR